MSASVVGLGIRLAPGSGAAAVLELPGLLLLAMAVLVGYGLMIRSAQVSAPAADDQAVRDGAPRGGSIPVPRPSGT